MQRTAVPNPTSTRPNDKLWFLELRREDLSVELTGLPVKLNVTDPDWVRAIVVLNVPECGRWIQRAITVSLDFNVGVILLETGGDEGVERTTGGRHESWDAEVLVDLHHVENDSIKALDVLVPLCHLVDLRTAVEDLFESWLLSDHHLVHKLEDLDQGRRVLRLEEKDSFLVVQILVSAFQLVRIWF